MGSTKIIPTIAEWQADFGKSLVGMYEDILSQASEVFEGAETPEAISKSWSEMYAKPVMQMWRETVVPMIEEQFNLPGAFYSTDKSKGVQRESESFLSGTVAPTLFEALENMRNRNIQLKSIYANILTGGTSLAVSPTQTAISKSSGGKSGLGSLIGAGAGLGLSALTGGLSLGGIGAGGLTFFESGALGALMGGAF